MIVRIIMFEFRKVNYDCGDESVCGDCIFVSPKELRLIAQGCRVSRRPWDGDKIVVFYPEWGCVICEIPMTEPLQGTEIFQARVALAGRMNVPLGRKSSHVAWRNFAFALTQRFLYFY